MFVYLLSTALLHRTAYDPNDMHYIVLHPQCSGYSRDKSSGYFCIEHGPVSVQHSPSAVFVGSNNSQSVALFVSIPCLDEWTGMDGLMNDDVNRIREEAWQRERNVDWERCD